MPRYAIKVVPTEWKDTMPLPFSHATRTYGRIEAGMHVLIFQEGLGIVGDSTIEGAFVRPAEWTQEALPPALANADYLLPLETLYYQGKTVPPDAVRQILSDPQFPQLDGWRPIDGQLYQQFIRRLI